MNDAIPSDQPAAIAGRAETIIEQSGLPRPILSLLLQVIRHTRLWKSEKVAVAMELIAHFRDGLDAGRSDDDLVATFGSPILVARLTRRAKKRNRPLWWWVWHRAWQGLLALLVIYVGSGLLLSLRHPHVSVDYVARLNAPIASVPADQKAWPIYRAALLYERQHKITTDSEDDFIAKDAQGKDLDRQLRPTDHDWNRALKVLDKHKNLIDAARAGGLKPFLGLPALPRADFSAQDREAFGMEEHPSDFMDIPPFASGSMISVLLPQLNDIFRMKDLLAMDCWRAASENDPARVVANYRAMLGLARQSAEIRLLVCQLVGVGIALKADHTLLELNIAYPDILNTHRVEIIHDMSAVHDLFDIDLSGEKMVMLDMVQRTYSDDGHGSGTLTLDGLKFLNLLVPSDIGQDQHERSRNITGFVREITRLPTMVAVSASRRELTDKINLMYGAMQQSTRRPLWEQLHDPSPNLHTAQALKSARGGMQYLLLSLLMPSMGKAGQQFAIDKAVHEAAMIALAIDVYHKQRGEYPKTLDDLVPQYLPAAPLDASTGEPLCYRLKDGRPLLYGRGRDGKDDGGVWKGKRDSWPKVPEAGDWVLYPPQ